MGRFDVIKRSAPSTEPTGKPTRRGNPAYRQFSAYIPVDVYVALKHRLIESGKDLSEAVEDALRSHLKM